MTKRMNKGSTRPKQQGTNANDAGSKIKDLVKKMDSLTAAVKKSKKSNRSGLSDLMGRAGTMLGAGISRITGFGDYVVHDNTMSKGGYSSIDVPNFGTGSSEVRVTHREFVKSISVPGDPTNFNNYTLDINPSNEVLFPWLSRIARNYQQYKINGMVFTFKSMTSEYASSGSLGTVGIATNYNVNDKPYENLVAFENSQFAVVNKPSLNIVHAIECKEFARNGLQLYVRDAESESTNISDARFYDYAKVQIMTEGLPQAVDTTLGQLWVSYDITLLKPIVGGTSAVPPAVARTILRSQADTTALQWLDNGDIYTDKIEWPAQALVPNTTFTSFSTAAGLNITSNKATTFSRTPTDLTLITASPSGGLRILRNGHYTLNFNLIALFNPNEYIVDNGTSTPTFTLYKGGSANAETIVKTDFDVAHAPITPSTSMGRSVTAGSGLITVVVSGITGTSGYVDIAATPWATWSNATQSADNVYHIVDVTWSDHGTLVA